MTLCIVSCSQYKSDNAANKLVNEEKTEKVESIDIENFFFD